MDFDKYLEHRLISAIEDYEIVKRTMQHTFISQMSQNLGFQMRCGQKMESNFVNYQTNKSENHNNDINDIANAIDLSKF